jgi:D-lactate dehydrogenase (cytochrome)
MTQALFEPVHPAHEDFLRDESRKAGDADTISFPKTEDEVRGILAECAAKNLVVTVQGGRTGITAGAVPGGGHILNLSRMNRITGLRHDSAAHRFFVSVQPGVLLTDLRQVIAKKEFRTEGWSPESLEALNRLKLAGDWFFPPDPTEATASLGGMISCNASGACTLLYGPTRKYVRALRMALADGTVLALRRGQPRAKGRRFLIAGAGGRIEGHVPSYSMPDVKSAAGYYAEDNMDLVDLFIGSEGTLGVLTEAELMLIPLPEFRWGVMAFLPSDETAVNFVHHIRGEDIGPAAIEFFDSRSLDLLREKRKVYAVLSEIPDIPPAFRSAVYVEFHGEDEEALVDAISRLTEIMAQCGGAEDATWTAMTDREMDRLHAVRHAVPEAVNLLIDERRKADPGITKLGTDMAVPDHALEKVMRLYRGGLEAAGLEYVMFGHIGNNHVHVNILPRSLAEYEKGRALYLDWAREIIRMGGTVSAEHGIGKLKVAFLREMYGDEGIEQMRAVKRLFDPGWRLNRGNLFEGK